MNIPDSNLPRIVIIGGGFAGITLAKKLKNKKVQVVLLDKHNYHTFQPLLYQVATGGLEAGSIAYPIRKVVQNFQNFFVRIAKVKEIDGENKRILSDIGELTYDYLVIATGSKTNYFGNKEIEKHSMPMKTIPQSLNIRSLVLENFEQALLTNDENERLSLMNFVIVGGGPTGVELAGALAEMKKDILPKDYPDLDITKMEINLVQGGGRLLDAMTPKSSAKAEEFLQNLGVKVFKNTRVTNYNGKVVDTLGELKFHTQTVIWSAGVMGAAIKGLHADAIVPRAERISVNEFNQVKGYKDIFALGDVASMVSEDFKFGHPMMAQPAIQQAEYLAENIFLLMDGKENLMKPFKYNDKGSMATIGRNKAVVDLPKFQFSGFFAWFVWMFIHLISLIGFKNKAVVLTNWLYNYIKLDREGRLIIRSYKKKNVQSFNQEEQLPDS